MSKLKSKKYSGKGNPNYGSGTNHSTEKSRLLTSKRWSGEGNPNYGKNPRLHGAGMKAGYKLSDETKQNMSIAGKGKPKSSEYRKHLSESLKGRPKPVGAGRKKGYKESDEVRLKRSTIMLGGNNPKAKVIRCIETDEVFECIKFACKKYHVSKNTIKNSCLNTSKTAAGYH